MKKTLLFITALLISSTAAWGQYELKRANNYFERAFYADAIPLYEEILSQNKSSGTVQNLADSYYNTFALEKAAKWYTYLIGNYGDKVDHEQYRKLFHSLQAIGEYDEASNLMLGYYKDISPAKADVFKEEMAYLDKIAALGDRFKIENLNINTEHSEFGAIVIDSVMVYSANKKSTGTFEKVYRWDNSNYLDLFSIPLDQIENGQLAAVPLSEEINSKMHEGTLAVTNDRKTIYFTRNNFIKGKKKTDDNKVSNLKIYRAENQNGNWTNIVELPFNSDDYSTAHPALSPDGKKLYFSSDRPGGFGSYDIYSVEILDNGSFGYPVNLGNTINTPEKEQFPFVDGRQNLYFSSNGLPGFGLMDIFLAKRDGGKFKKPDNIGKPVNGGYDDFAITVLKDNKSGYFSSNRPGGAGSDDIYFFRETKPLEIDCANNHVGVILDKETKKPIENSEVQLLLNGKKVQTKKTAPNGSFDFDIDCQNDYTISANKEGYEVGQIILEDNNAKFSTLYLEASANNDGNTNGNLTNIDPNNLNEGNTNGNSGAGDNNSDCLKDGFYLIANVFSTQFHHDQFMGQMKQQGLKPNSFKRQSTGFNYVYLQHFKTKAEADEAKKTRLDGKYEGELWIVEEKGCSNLKKVDGKIEKAINSEEAIVSKREKAMIETEPIYFDYDKWYLRRYAKKSIDNVIDVMKRNPGIILEIGAHTDIRGELAYNEELAQKRANSVLTYMIKEGIDAKRITAKGYGETQPIAYCKDEESCSEESHEANRRCEFVIVNWKQ